MRLIVRYKLKSISIYGAVCVWHLSFSNRSVFSEAIKECKENIQEAILIHFEDCQEDGTRQMIEQCYSGDLAQTERLMRHYHQSLRQSTSGLNKLYLHITFRCNLRCTHCYAAKENHLEFADISLIILFNFPFLAFSYR